MRCTFFRAHFLAITCVLRCKFLIGVVIADLQVKNWEASMNRAEEWARS